MWELGVLFVGIAVLMYSVAASIAAIINANMNIQAVDILSEMQRTQQQLVQGMDPEDGEDGHRKPYQPD